MRLLNDWLSGYIQFTSNTESPLAYHTWAGIATISAALQRRVFMHWGHTKIYPNQYIILVGPSGMARKGEPLTICKPFFEHLGLPVASQAITREALIRMMGNSTTSFIDKKKNYVLQSPVNIIANELFVFTGQKNIKLLGDLTDMYDSQASWSYETKHGEQTKDSISGVCINILASTAPDWIPAILPEEAVGGGWSSRVFFIVEEEKGKVVSDPNKFPIDRNLESKLKNDIEQIHLMIGEYKFSPKALDAYVNWYEDQEAKIKQGIMPIVDPRFNGYTSRRATHIKKLGMCLSASRGNDFVITEEDFKRSLKLMEVTEKKMTKAFRGMGKSDLAEITDKVLSFIIMKGKTRRSEVMRALYGDIDAWTLEQVEKILEQMHVVKIGLIIDENEAEYTYLGIPGQ